MPEPKYSIGASVETVDSARIRFIESRHFDDVMLNAWVYGLRDPWNGSLSFRSEFAIIV